MTAEDRLITDLRALRDRTTDADTLLIADALLFILGVPSLEPEIEELKQAIGEVHREI